FPRLTFTGRVVQVRKGALVVQNVVTYNVVISVQNTDQKLLPGMTANVKIVVDQKRDVLKVPTAALRFRPPGEPETAVSRNASAEGGAQGVVWIAGAGGKPVAVPVRLGIGDGAFVEALSGDLRDGQEVIVGVPDSVTPPGGGGLRLRF